MPPDNEQIPGDPSIKIEPEQYIYTQPVIKSKKTRKHWVLIIIVIVLITLITYGFLIFRDYRKNARLDSDYDAQRAEISAHYKDGKPETVETLGTAEIKDWATYTDPTGFFEFRYPADWSLLTNLGICKTDAVVSSANGTQTGSCVSDKDGQVLVEVAQGQLLRSKYEIEDPAFTSIQTDSYFIDGVASFKELGTKIQPENVYPDIAVGDQILIYIFQKDDYTYVARCTLSDKNVSKTVQRDFETMVNKTLKFKK